MKRIFLLIFKPFRTMWFMLKWRRKNRHNSTFAMNIFHAENVIVGNETYGPIEVLYDSGTGRLEIGNYCSLAREVKFLLGGGHNYRKISTYPFLTRIYKGKNAPKRNSKIDIVVEDDVWIGYNSIVLAGARIGKGSVIGARSVVTGNVPPYSVYVGNRVIKKRFSDEIISQVESIDFSKIKHHLGDEYEAYVNKEVTMDNICEIVKAFQQ